MVIPSSDIDLIETLRLRPGDTIQLRHGSDKTWTERRRTLLWHGEQVAVWSATSRWSWEFFNSLTSSGKYSAYKIAGALYKNWYFLKSYQLKGVCDCVNDLVPGGNPNAN